MYSYQRDVDQWYCCITAADDDEEKSQREPTTTTIENANAIGVDVGLLNNWLTLSTGEKIHPNEQLDFKSQEKHIKELQRSLSRKKKKKGSYNREKSRIALAKAWRKVRRQREDYCHKISKKLADEYTFIVFEKLNVANMVKNHKLAKAIMDATWGKLRQYAAYKVEERRSGGGQCIIVNPSGTSQKCSKCGKDVKKKDLSVRVHECPNCGLVLNRDQNAAINILKRGQELAHAETEPLLVKQISKFQSMKQEAQEFIRG
jgi:putative transposase